MKTYYMITERDAEERRVAVKVQAVNIEDAMRCCNLVINQWEEVVGHTDIYSIEGKVQVGEYFAYDFGAFYEGCECVLLDEDKAYHQVGSWEEVDNYIEESELEELKKGF